MSLEAQVPKKDRGPTKLLVPLVIVIGIFLGVVLSYLLPLPPSLGPFPHFVQRIRNLLILDMILSTVSISLLVTLVVVYAGVYAKTGARFALGILVVMLALLLETVVRYPLVLAYAGKIPISLGPYFSAADLLSIAAYTIFLYLSLE